MSLIELAVNSDPASIVPFLIMIFFIHISPADIFKVDLIPFIFSSMSIMGKYLLQAVRFKYFIKKFIGHNVVSTGETLCVSLGSQFVTQTTPSYVGGELVRIAWLTKKGVLTGKAAWITTMEIVADVFVGTFLAIMAGAASILHGGYFIGIIVILITIPTFAFWFLLMFFSARRGTETTFILFAGSSKVCSKGKGAKIYHLHQHCNCRFMSYE